MTSKLHKYRFSRYTSKPRKCDRCKKRRKVILGRNYPQFVEFEYWRMTITLSEVRLCKECLITIQGKLNKALYGDKA